MQNTASELGACAGDQARNAGKWALWVTLIPHADRSISSGCFFLMYAAVELRCLHVVSSELYVGLCLHLRSQPAAAQVHNAQMPAVISEHDGNADYVLQSCSAHATRLARLLSCQTCA